MAAEAAAPAVDHIPGESQSSSQQPPPSPQSSSATTTRGEKDRSTGTENLKTRTLPPKVPLTGGREVKAEPDLVRGPNEDLRV